MLLVVSLLLWFFLTLLAFLPFFMCQHVPNDSNLVSAIDRV